jgi:hypothetical protein
MSGEPDEAFERWPTGSAGDETDYSLRAYVSSLSDSHLAQYDPNWSHEQVMAWDGNFRSDGALMLVCCERDVNVQEFRQVLEEYLRYRREKGLHRTG